MNYLKILFINFFILTSLCSEEITSYVDRAIVSSDNHMMALTSYADKTHSLSLWDMNQTALKMVKKFDFDDDTFFSENMVFSHDNQYLVMGVANHTYVWHTKTHELVKKIPNYFEVSAVEFSHDDKYLLVGTANSRVTIFDVKNDFAPYKLLEGKELSFKEKLFPKSRYGTTVYDFSFSPDDNYLVITFEIKDAQLYDVKDDFKLVKKFDNKEDYIYETHFSNDGKYFIISRNEVELEVFSAVPPFKKLKTIKKRSGEEIYATKLSNTNRYYLSSWDYEGDIKVWDIQDGFRQITLLNGHREYTTSLEFYENDKYMISVGGDDRVKIWKVRGWKHIATLTLNQKHGFSYEKISK
jgi:WD40 repeat protein